jgi:hypothetical protein
MEPDHSIESEFRPHVINSVSVSGASGRSSVRCVKKIKRRAERPGERVRDRQERTAQTDTPKTADKAASLRRRDSRSSSNDATASAPVNSVERANAQASEPPERNLAGRDFNVDKRYGHRTGTLSRTEGKVRGGVGGLAYPCLAIASLETLNRLETALGKFRLPLPARTIPLAPETIMGAMGGLRHHLSQPQPLREKLNRLRAHSHLSRAMIQKSIRLIAGGVQ